MNSTIIDIVFILFFVFMAIVGYKNGFIARLYDLLSLILVIFLSVWLAKPLSSVFQLYHYNQEDVISLAVGQLINQVIVFLVLFVILFIIKKVIGFVIKPTLKGILHKFSITAAVDKLLGLCISLVEGVILSYIVVLLLITPLYPQGQQMIEETVIAKRVLNVVPSVTADIQNLSHNYQDFRNYDLQSFESTEHLTQTMLLIERLGLLDDEQFMTIFDSHIREKLQHHSISLSLEEKQKIQEFLKQSHYSQKEINQILEKIKVRE